MKKEFIKAALRLFNAVLSNGKTHDNLRWQSQTVRDGFIFDPKVVPSQELVKTVSEVMGMGGERANASFHKSWEKIQNASIEQLVVEQIVHYITTYGFEALGMYDESTVYIPSEQLEIPEISENIRLTVVKGLTWKELQDKIVELGSSGIALHEETLQDIMTIVEEGKFDSSFVALITNRELKGKLSDYYNLVPQEPVEFLRYVVSKLTDQSLLIKNKWLIDQIKASDGKFLDSLMKDAPGDLASIFYRFKPIFLAMKSISKNKKFYNDLRRKAVSMHKPMPKDVLNEVTSDIKKGNLVLNSVEKKLNTASIWRKVRLLYALKNRLNPGDSVVYKIRNGRGWVTDFEWDLMHTKSVSDVFSMVLESIENDMGEKIKSKVFIIPENVKYALPATEKQFIGNFPSGSYICVPRNDLIVGIHWFDVDGHRIDLDLSMANADQKIGWDSLYRTESRSIMFSGDMTSAPKPKGASELFYIRDLKDGSYNLNVNCFNFSASIPVPAQIIIAQEKPERFGRNYMVNPNNIIAHPQINVTEKQTVLGLLTTVGEENRFYLSSSSVGNSISFRDQGLTKKVLDFNKRTLLNGIYLESVLAGTGAEILREMPEEMDPEIEYIDMRPESIDKSTFINLMS